VITLYTAATTNRHKVSTAPGHMLFRHFPKRGPAVVERCQVETRRSSRVLDALPEDPSFWLATVPLPTLPTGLGCATL
jgi:hypothetical protein